jgi:hypothetical protein
LRRREVRVDSMAMINNPKFAYQFDQRLRRKAIEDPSQKPSAPPEHTIKGMLVEDIYLRGKAVLGEGLHADSELMGDMGISLTVEELKEFLKRS